MIGWPGRRREADLDEELASHFRLAVEDRMARGASRAEAERAARREFGSELLVREATRRQWRWFWLERSMAGFALALRALGRSPRFFVAAWLCIAVGIGATVTIFAVLRAVLLRPLPYADEDGLVVVEALRGRRSTRFAQLTQEEMSAIRSARSLGRVGTWRGWEIDVGGDGDPPERVLEAEVDANLLPVLGVRAVLGRWPRADEDRSDVVVLSHDLWQRRYGGDAQLIGRSIRVDGRAHEVIGVMPEEFSVPEGTQLWRPLAAATYPPHILFYGGAIGRLAPGADVARARAELTTLLESLKRRFPDDYSQTTYRVNSLRQALVGPLRRPILIFQAAALLVLLIACANVAALQLARNAARRREFALRSAIGAGRAGLAGHVLTECIALALIGGLGGLLLSFAGLRVVALAFPDGVPSYIDLAVDARVLAVALGATMFAALLFGIGPALRAARTRAPLALDGSMGGAASTSPASRHFTSLLVVAEVAVSVVLVAGAVLLIRSNAAIRDSLGFEPERMLSVRVPLGYREYREPERRAAFYRQLEARLRALPGVEAVTSSFNAVPLDGPVAGRQPLRIAGREERVSVQWVAPEYARTLGARLLDGRDLTKNDVGGAEHAALVNRTFAATWFAAERAVGSIARFENDTAASAAVRIVGVIENIRHERQPADVPPAMYIPDPDGTASQTFVLRTRLEDPMSLAPAIRALVHELDPALTTSRLQAQTRVVQRAFWRERLQRDVLTIFAGLALLLAACGMYGVLSYTVAQRTSEFGVRAAVGASSLQLLLLVLREAVSLALPGVLFGSMAAVALTRLLASAAWGVPTSDAPALAIVAGGLLIVSLFAAAAPAWRAARLDPLTALRRA